MNKIMKIAVFGFLSAFIFSGCSKKVSEIIYQGGTSPVLVTSVSADSVSYANADKTILTLNWTNPNYTFTTGTSSLDVTYTLQVDTAGANFNNAYTVTVSKDLSDQFTASALNDIMQNQLNLKPNIQHKLEMRVISTLLNNSASLNSNTVQFNATPYVIPPKVEPFAYALFITGSATDGGWMVGGGVGVPTNQQFIQIDTLHYTITLHLNAGQEYLMIPVNGDWGHKYACKDKAAQSQSGGDFGRDLGDNFPGPVADGTYKIDVDFQKGKYTVTKQ